ncbi:MAG: restriction endonuclease subunit S [Treponema sp.]
MNSKMENAPFVELGDLIEICDNRNIDKKYGINDVCGMTIEKEIIPTKADIKDTDLSKFYIVQPQEFVYNPRTHGRKIGLGFNNSDKPILISWNNTAFKVKDMKRIVPTYLYMIFTREEWNREACFNSWGSSTVVFSWEDFCKIKIPLPSIKTQNEVVAVYHGLKKLAEENEKLLEPLSKSCEAFIADCKNKYEWKRLGDYIEETDERNSASKYKLDAVRGISTEKRFISTKANLDGVSLTSYKIVLPREFVYVADTSRRGEKIALALNDSTNAYLISSIYTTFCLKDVTILLPEYLYLFFNRIEFNRYARYTSWGSARETFDWSEMCRVQIPLPPKEIQQKIVDLYNCYEECKRIANEARAKINNLCPALVQKAAHSK